MDASSPRRSFLAGSAAALAAVAVPRSRARAATLSYKWGHDLPFNHPAHVRLVEMSRAIRAETAGRVDIAIMGNNVLGNDPAMLSQLRSGALQFFSMQGLNFASVVPSAMLDGIGFAFKTTDQAVRAFEGDLGDIVRTDMASKTMHGLRPVFAIGFREITSGTRPVRGLADLAGFKIRTPPAKIALDLFQTLGAAPTPLAFGEVYTALQTHVVDGQETPYAVIESSHFYEVQKYLSPTNHMFTCFWNVANPDAWNAIAPGDRAVIEKHLAVAATAVRGDVQRMDSAVADKLRRSGLQFVDVDVTSLRRALGPYYARWKAEFGPSTWALLEKYTGPVA
ncbi:MAG: TRAP transporter substrate-binding protein [Vulcanimicrobiaceae bacterium]|jgi:tripartite ATP-independent transporter DctP family solute receptor